MHIPWLLLNTKTRMIFTLVKGINFLTFLRYQIILFNKQLSFAVFVYI